MRFKCPNCNEIRSASGFPCGRASCEVGSGPLLRLMDASFGKEWDAYLEKFKVYREDAKIRILDPEAYDKMPYGKGATDLLESTWAERRKDLEILKALISNDRKLDILNFGAWNGWLSHQLSLWGHRNVAVSAFADPFDGVGAVEHFSTRWTAIQAELEYTDLWVDPFDVIIFNRNLSFFANPIQQVREMIPKVKPGGKLIFTGLHFYRDSKPAETSLRKSLSRISEKYDFQLEFKPMKGVLDFDDLEAFRKLGGEIVYQQPIWKSKWLPSIVPYRALTGTGVIQV